MGIHAEHVLARSEDERPNQGVETRRGPVRIAERPGYVRPTGGHVPGHQQGSGFGQAVEDAQVVEARPAVSRGIDEPPRDLNRLADRHAGAASRCIEEPLECSGVAHGLRPRLPTASLRQCQLAR
jgi:hypothetical protein